MRRARSLQERELDVEQPRGRLSASKGPLTWAGTNRQQSGVSVCESPINLVVMRTRMAAQPPITAPYSEIIAR